ncbi:hypothetical protein CIHG_02616, partial [Coccidioides immitis H538.4]
KIGRCIRASIIRDEVPQHPSEPENQHIPTHPSTIFPKPQSMIKGDT